MPQCLRIVLHKKRSFSLNFGLVGDNLEDSQRSVFLQLLLYHTADRDHDVGVAVSHGIASTTKPLKISHMPQNSKISGTAPQQ